MQVGARGGQLRWCTFNRDELKTLAKCVPFIHLPPASRCCSSSRGWSASVKPIKRFLLVRHFCRNFVGGIARRVETTRTTGTVSSRCLARDVIIICCPTFFEKVKAQLKTSIIAHRIPVEAQLKGAVQPNIEHRIPEGFGWRGATGRHNFGIEESEGAIISRSRIVVVNVVISDIRLLPTIGRPGLSARALN